MWILIVILSVFSTSAPADAASLFLTDGSVLQGEILSESPDSIVIRTSFATVGIARRDILSRQDKTPPKGASVTEASARLHDSYGKQENAAARRLIADVWGEPVAASFDAMDRRQKAEFLDSVWRKKSALLHKYYYGYHLGRRHFSVSPAYFERGGLIQRRYVSGFPGLHPDDIEKAAGYAQQILNAHPDDAVAMCALGYLHLEADKIEEALECFTKALKSDRYLVEARNGRALAYIKMHHQKARALRLFRETLAMDRTYVDALYAMGMCHIAMMGQDRVGLDEYFGKIVEVDPNHPDAHFKLGAFNEALRRMDRAAEHYSRQLAANPAHKRASERLAHVSMMLKGTDERHLTHAELERLSQREPATYLPLLADSHVERGDYGKAEETYRSYLALLPSDERHYYHDLSLIADPETLRSIEEAYPREERQRLIRRFWVLNDPTPTTPVNERRVEHYRRIYHARTNYAEGLDPLSLLGWDRRGDIYIRFGAPDHQSWSDFLVFETKPEVAKVKNRINNLAHNALLEVVPPRHLHSSSVTGGSGGQVSADVRGIPTFPLPRRTTLMRDGVETGYEWESWIYGNVGGGIEITFIDEIGKGFYKFARTPPGSPNHLLWQQLAPETVVGRIVSETPSTYDHAYGGDPLDLFVSTASFRGEDGHTDLEVYLGVPLEAVRTPSGTAVIERDVAFYDQDWKLASRTSDHISEPVAASVPTESGLLVDQVRAPLRPGRYYLAAQVRQAESGRIQIHKSTIDVPGFHVSDENFDVSDLEVAGRVDPVTGTITEKWRKGQLEVVPLPTHRAPPGQPVALYFEIYGLSRDTYGKTRYRVDYEVETGESGWSIAGSIGRLVGAGPDEETSRVSYEHEGDSRDEQMHVNLSLPPASSGPTRVTVRVTDLGRSAHPTQTRSVEITVAE